MFGEVYEQLSDEDKALIVDWNEEDGYKFTDKEDLAQCPTCENDIPDPMMTCCFCAEKFD